MGSVHLALSGNSFHSDVSQEQWSRLDNERLGLDAIGDSGLPVSVSFQGIDFDMFPWLKRTLSHYPSIECISATYGHGLIPFMHPDQQRWEVASGPHHHSVTFFPEFYTPKAMFIPNMFFVLGPQTVLYAQKTGTSKKSEQICMPTQIGDPEMFSAICYGQKTGLVMRGFSDLLQAFFAFQKHPHAAHRKSSPLAQLLRTLEHIAVKTSDIAIMPMDLEAPYVGSREGEKIWEILFNALKRSGLDSIFVSMQDVINETAHKPAPEVSRPHRELTPKWFGYEAQFAYYSFIRQFRPTSEQEHFILSLAAASDALSALYRKITLGKTGKRMDIQTIDLGGRTKMLEVGHDSNNIFALCQSALLALRMPAKLTHVIHKNCNTGALLVKRALSWAEMHNL